MTITVCHNPACGTSRNTLVLIRNSSTGPEVIEYLKTPPSRDVLLGLIQASGLPVRASAGHPAPAATGRPQQEDGEVVINDQGQHV